MGWAFLRRLGAVFGAVAMILTTAPVALADPPIGGAVVDAPTLSLEDLGLASTLSFFGSSSTTTLTIPVPAGLTPASLNTTVDLPFNIQSGILTVTQNDRLISKLGLPLADLAPLVIPLAGVQVVDKAVQVTLTLNALPEDGYCLAYPNGIDFINTSVSYVGTEVAPNTVADFLPPVLRQLTIAVPAKPSQAESDAAVQLATALVSRYRAQAPRVIVLPLPDNATALEGVSQPLERQIIIKEGPNEGLSLSSTDGVPALLISGQANKLTNQTKLLTDGSLDLAASSNVVAGDINSDQKLPGNYATLAQLGLTSLNSSGLQPKVEISLDQTQFGHPVHGLRVHLLGSYTPLPKDVGGQVTATAAGTIIDRWPTDTSGAIDHWVAVPDQLLQRYTGLSVEVDTTGYLGRCGEYQPVALNINGNSVVTSTPALPPIPPGFGSVPQALMPRIQVGISPTNFADTVRAIQIAVGLQRLSVVRLATSVKSLQQAIDSHDPAVLISSNGWTDKSITLPVTAGADKQVIVKDIGADGSPGSPTTLTLNPGTKFGSVQALFDGHRSLVIATSNGAPEQLDGLLRWLDDDPRHWQQLSGSAVVEFAGGAPAIFGDRSLPAIPGTPTFSQQQPLADGQYRSSSAWWIAAALVVVAAAGAAVFVFSARRVSSDADSSHHRG